MFKTKLFIVTLGALFILPAAAADESASLFKDNGIEVGGWINAGITYNANNPTNRFNGPVTFADRSKEFQLNQLNLFMQRAVATEGKAWDFGGRFDLMFGTDAIFTQAYGIPSFDALPDSAFIREAQLVQSPKRPETPAPSRTAGARATTLG